MVFSRPPAPLNPLRAAIAAAYLADETECVDTLLSQTPLDGLAHGRVTDLAWDLVTAVREKGPGAGGMDAFLHEYNLSSEEGVVLMCLAEALLRIPDPETADRLIRDKLSKGRWDSHLGHSHSLLVNASTWGLMLTGRIVNLDGETVDDTGGLLQRLVLRGGEPLIRMALRQAMRIMSHQFVMGRTIEEALARSHEASHHPYRHSFDMLGEAALTAADAERYFQAYSHAIEALAADKRPGTELRAAPGISVKLSALHPRFSFAQHERVLEELPPRLLELALRARAAGIGLTVDAEESETLDLLLDVFEAVFRAPELADWEGLGLAVQAYQKRAVHVIDWLRELSRQVGRRLALRLVKGAYWDSEIKRAQERGLPGYPVFTRKVSTDVSYLVCARRMLDAPEAFYAQFATHNAHTVAAVMEMAVDRRDYEFQRLHGMGHQLYEEVTRQDRYDLPCRIYAPVGSHRDLLPYLVRRLLENGANTSFINRILDERTPIEDVIGDPLLRARRLAAKPHPRIPLPIDLYQPERRNSQGLNLADRVSLTPFAADLERALKNPYRAAPLVSGKALAGAERPVLDPSDRRRQVGVVAEADAAHVEHALEAAVAAAGDWDRTPAAARAAILDRAADLLEAHQAELIALCVREGGKTIPDALGEVREAADHCRYYGVHLRHGFAAPLALPGPTGERNELQLHGRGAFACISPWNFPLAIFIGQVSAALAAGNAVVAKPAAATPLVAHRAVELLFEAGIPPEVLHLLPGSGSALGGALAADPRVGGIAFTGSTETAWEINRALAGRNGPIVPLIAETGGLNAMIVDSSALPEQVVVDALYSAFNSAGQRCSALRVLFVQDEIAPRVIDLLGGGLQELSVGDPGLLSTDVGPVISEQARSGLEAHIDRLSQAGRLIARGRPPADGAHGSFVPPAIIELPELGLLQREVFGPVLHVIRYGAGQLDRVIDAINATGYGLTLGIHSRVEETARYVQQRTRAGNTYVNRNMIGAVVGSQPFGGEGLSGTGPKAGGPHYLLRFAMERTFTVNSAAVGGNAALLSMDED